MVRDWADEDRLTPAGFNEVVTSMNMRFASASQRDSVLVGALAPVAGMTVNLLDTNLTWKYIMVDGVGYWAPQPSTLCVAAYQTVAQTLTGGTAVNLITSNMGGLIGARNTGGWFNTANGRFTPRCPGVYEFSGGVSLDHNGGDSLTPIRVGCTFNGAATLLTASEGRGIGAADTVTHPFAIPIRKFPYFMNGITDYMTLGLVLAGAASTTTSVASGRQSMLNVRYLGP